MLIKPLTPCRRLCMCVCVSAAYVWSNLLTQPLDSVAEYYGESVAFYFAYLAFYTRWLIVPSLLGIVVFFFQVERKCVCVYM